MDPVTIAALVSLGAKGISALFGHRASNARNANQRSAQIAGLNLQQQRSEDSRRARLNLGAGMLNGVPGSTAGGRVNTNVALDPELLRTLGQERRYNFAAAVPNESAGSGSNVVAGLFNGVADTAPYAISGARPAAPTGLGNISFDQLMELVGRRRAPGSGPAPGFDTPE